MSARELSPREYWATSQYDIDMILAVHHAYAEGRDEAAADIKAEAEEAERLERIRKEQMEAVRAKAGL